MLFLSPRSYLHSEKTVIYRLQNHHLRIHTETPYSHLTIHLSPRTPRGGLDLHRDARAAAVPLELRSPTGRFGGARKIPHSPPGPPASSPCPQPVPLPFPPLSAPRRSPPAGLPAPSPHLPPRCLRRLLRGRAVAAAQPAGGGPRAPLPAPRSPPRPPRPSRCWPGALPCRGREFPSDRSPPQPAGCLPERPPGARARYAGKGSANAVPRLGIALSGLCFSEKVIFYYYILLANGISSWDADPCQVRLYTSM